MAGEFRKLGYDESPRTTKLYHRTNDAIRAEAISDDGLSLDEIERILMEFRRRFATH